MTISIFDVKPGMPTHHCEDCKCNGCNAGVFTEGNDEEPGQCIRLGGICGREFLVTEGGMLQVGA